MSSSRRISIIIPAVNEAAAIGKTLRRAKAQKPLEIIVVAGDDATAHIAKSSARIIKTRPAWRAKLMNKGARAAKGDALLFLHADTLLPRGALRAIPADAHAAAFFVRFDVRHWLLWLTEVWANHVRLRRGIVFGDHGLFITKRLLRAVGGWREMPIFEDLDMCKRLRQRVRIHRIPLAVVTSARRYVDRGMLTQWSVNQCVKLFYFLGASPRFIRRFYRASRGSN